MAPPKMGKPKLLITGINGLIGGILAQPLSEAYDVHGIDVKPPHSGHVFKADMAEYETLVSVFEEIAPLPYIVHLAAESNVNATWDVVLRSNIIGTRNLYEVARKFDSKHIVFASSNHVTGSYEDFHPLHLHLQPEPDRITVQDPIRPDSDYGVSKAFGEAIARYYCARWGIKSICLRIGSVRKDDNPAKDPRLAKTWLSHRDLVQLVGKSLASNVTFGIYYGVSNNSGSFWDISNARNELSYAPQDDAFD